MARPHSAVRRGCHSTGQVPNLPSWEKTTQNERRMQNLNRNSSRSVEELYENANCQMPPPGVGKDEADVYRKFYTLEELAAAFELPQSARVVEGYYGPTETSKISQDSLLLMCYKKETKVVQAEDTYGTKYSIPRDSSLKFVPMDPTYGLQGHVYNSLEEILSCSELPRVVHIDAQTAFNLRLHTGDQLIFPSRKEPNTFGKSCLICYDQRNNKFNLPATQHGSFSTHPDKIGMYMDDCIQFIRKFPIKVAIRDVNNTMPPGTHGSILMLTDTKNEHSLVAKTGSKTEGGHARMIELPFGIPIKLQCLQTTCKKETVDVYQNCAVENYNTATTESAYELQNQLYMNTKPQTTATQQLEKYVTIKRQVTSAVGESKQRRHTAHEPLYENLVPPQKPPKPKKSEDASNGYHARSRQSMSLPTISAQIDMHNTAPLQIRSAVPPKPPTVPRRQSTHDTAPPKATPSIPEHQPTSKFATPQPVTNVPQADPTHNVALPTMEQLPTPNTNTVKDDTVVDDEQNEDIYTVIPSEEPKDDDSDDYVSVTSPPATAANTEGNQQQQRLQKLEASNKELHTQLMQVTTQLTQVTTQLTHLEASVAQLLQLVVTRKPEDNIKQLSFLDSEKVLTMLQAMGLSMYEHIFREHKVDGTKMTRLDSKKLSQYGITNPQDQSKLMDIIRGSISPLSYLLRPSTSNSNDDINDNYVRFTKT